MPYGISRNSRKSTKFASDRCQTDRLAGRWLVALLDGHSSDTRHGSRLRGFCHRRGGPTGPQLAAQRFFVAALGGCGPRHRLQTPAEPESHAADSGTSPPTRKAPATRIRQHPLPLTNQRLSPAGTDNPAGQKQGAGKHGLVRKTQRAGVLATVLAYRTEPSYGPGRPRRGLFRGRSEILDLETPGTRFGLHDLLQEGIGMPGLQMTIQIPGCSGSSLQLPSKQGRSASSNSCR